jgi:diacylglycerol kinase family enzyme
METVKTNLRPKRVKLIFNPGSGANEESPLQILAVIKEMQAWKLVPELYLIEPDSNLKEVVNEAITQGIDLFVVCGGDGTVSSVTKALYGSAATLGIVPTGTQNNVALSLGIPTDISAAIAVLRTGQPLKIDLGMVTCNDVSTPFIELCSVGLFSMLFPSGDDIQHGNITRIGDFLGILTTAPPSEIHLFLDDNREINALGHAALISNMPYIGRNYQVGAADAYHDGLLDVMFFSDLSKLDLIAYILNGVGTDNPEDPRIQHYQVREIIIDTEPSMAVMADDISLGEGSVQITVKQQAMSVMVGATESNEEP